jgi:hypothetical protein
MGATDGGLAGTMAIFATPPNPSPAPVNAVTKKAIVEINMARSPFCHAYPSKRAVAQQVPPDFAEGLSPYLPTARTQAMAIATATSDAAIGPDS